MLSVSYRRVISQLNADATRLVALLHGRLGIKETQVLHYAVRQLARDVLPAYEADDGALSAAQLRAIRKAVPEGKSKSVKSSLF